MVRVYDISGCCIRYVIIDDVDCFVYVIYENTFIMNKKYIINIYISFKFTKLQLSLI